MTEGHRGFGVQRRPPRRNYVTSVNSNVHGFSRESDGSDGRPAANGKGPQDRLGDPSPCAFIVHNNFTT
jgi:hypothetical protein